MRLPIPSATLSFASSRHVHNESIHLSGVYRLYRCLPRALAAIGRSPQGDCHQPRAKEPTAFEMPAYGQAALDRFG